jgi:hypothetical protein
MAVLGHVELRLVIASLHTLLTGKLFALPAEWMPMAGCSGAVLSEAKI